MPINNDLLNDLLSFNKVNNKYVLFTYCNEIYLDILSVLLYSIKHNTTNIDEVVLCFFEDKTSVKLSEIEKEYSFLKVEYFNTIKNNKKHVIEDDFVYLNEAKFPKDLNINYLFFKALPIVLEKYKKENCIICDADIFFNCNYNHYNNKGIEHSIYEKFPYSWLENDGILNKMKREDPTIPLIFKNKMKIYKEKNCFISAGFFAGSFDNMINKFNKINEWFNSLSDNEIFNEYSFSIDEVALSLFFDFKNDSLISSEKVSIIGGEKSELLNALNNKKIKVIHIYYKKFYNLKILSKYIWSNL